MRTKPATTRPDLAQRILSVRKELYLSQEELATKLGVNGITVSRWERAIRTPDARARRALAELSGRTPEYFKLAATPALAKLESEPGLA